MAYEWVLLIFLFSIESDFYDYAVNPIWKGPKPLTFAFLSLVWETRDKDLHAVDDVPNRDSDYVVIILIICISQSLLFSTRSRLFLVKPKIDDKLLLFLIGCTDLALLNAVTQYTLDIIFNPS